MEAAGYTSREAARLFGLRPARVRAMARAGILRPTRGPRREYRFSFQDLAFLRTAKQLLDSPVPVRRVHRVLRQVTRNLPRDRSPSELHLTVEQGRVVARDGLVLWSPESGQCWLDFAPPPRPASALAPREAGADLAEGWYQHGLDLEPFDLPGARAAYSQALSLDPRHIGARVNLGRLLQSTGDAGEAIRHYRAVLEIEPCHVTAAFNLGSALELLGSLEEAIAAYRLALSTDPRLADAHYNLSLLYQQTGHKLAALVHLKRYRELAER